MAACLECTQRYVLARCESGGSPLGACMFAHLGCSRVMTDAGLFAALGADWYDGPLRRLRERALLAREQGRTDAHGLHAAIASGLAARRSLLELHGDLSGVLRQVQAQGEVVRDLRVALEDAKATGGALQEEEGGALQEEEGGAQEESHSLDLRGRVRDLDEQLRQADPADAELRRDLRRAQEAAREALREKRKAPDTHDRASLLPDTDQAAHYRDRVRDLEEQVEEASVVLTVLQDVAMELSRDEKTVVDDACGVASWASAGGVPLFRCPQPGCMGVVAQGRCGLCSREACALCEESRYHDASPRGLGCPPGVPPREAGCPPPHVCRPSALASVRLVRGEARACPGCAVPTLRRDGCPDMWCTRCHTSYDWDTLSITRGTQNPHFAEHLEQQRRGGRRPTPLLLQLPYVCGAEFGPAALELRLLRARMHVAFLGATEAYLADTAYRVEQRRRFHAQAATLLEGVDAAAGKIEPLPAVLFEDDRYAQARLSEYERAHGSVLERANADLDALARSCGGEGVQLRVAWLLGTESPIRRLLGTESPIRRLLGTESPIRRHDGSWGRSPQSGGAAGLGLSLVAGPTGPLDF
jgi:hypothetical protein